MVFNQLIWSNHIFSISPRYYKTNSPHLLLNLFSLLLSSHIANIIVVPYSIIFLSTNSIGFTMVYHCNYHNTNILAIPTNHMGIQYFCYSANGLKPDVPVIAFYQWHKIPQKICMQFFAFSKTRYFLFSYLAQHICLSLSS